VFTEAIEVLCIPGINRLNLRFQSTAGDDQVVNSSAGGRFQEKQRFVRTCPAFAGHPGHNRIDLSEAVRSRTGRRFFLLFKEREARLVMLVFSAHPVPKRLYQIRAGAMLSGVCAGLAAYLNIDVTIVRILFVVLTVLTGGLWILVYIAMMLVVPFANTGEEHAAAAGTPYNAQEVIDRAKKHYGEFKDSILLSGATKTGEQECRGDWTARLPSLRVGPAA
jgi:phage shock protein PspC (stress-responsive transcriptional regulator)